MPQHGNRKLVERKKNRGTLRLRINKESFFFKRDFNDLTSLEKSGFAEGSDEFFRAYGKVYKNRSLAAIQSAAYWRIHPDQPRYFQLCDQDGTVLHIEEVRTQYGERKLSNGYLNIFLNNKQIKFKRDPKDTASLEENGFAEGQAANIWKPSKNCENAANAAICDHDQQQHQSVIDSIKPSTPVTFFAEEMDYKTDSDSEDELIIDDNCDNTDNLTRYSDSRNSSDSDWYDDDLYDYCSEDEREFEKMVFDILPSNS